MSDRFHCPRRAATGNVGGWDKWATGQGPSAQAAKLHCSYCGSLKPALFMELAHAGWLVIPTDKADKGYLSQPLTDEEKERRRMAWRADWRPVAFSACVNNGIVKPVAEDVEIELEQMWAQNGRDLVWGITSGVQFKFYYQHLSTAERREFVEMHNNGAMNIGYPGYFYVLPFFVAELENNDAAQSSDVA